jgi:formate dehydrogenase subunit gamma
MAVQERRRVLVRRYSLFERVIHWAVALTFVYLMLSGLALFWPPFFWFAHILGGPTLVRIVHPYVGVAFIIFLLIMLGMWARDMILDRLDFEWLKAVPKYATGQEEGVPESGRFNAGQKLLFYTQIVAGILLLLSGIVLWFPIQFSGGLRQASFIIHDLMAIIAIGALILHIYMGLFYIRGSLQGMVEGVVSRAWAQAHHGRWYRQVEGTSAVITEDAHD